MLHRSTNYILVSFLLDLLIVEVALLLAWWLRLNIPIGKEILTEPGLPILLVLAGLIYPLVFFLFSIYDPDRSFRVLDEYQVLTVASFIGGLALAGLVYFTVRDVSRLYLLYFYTIHFILVIFWRDLVRKVRTQINGKGLELRRVLLVGGGETGKHTLDRLAEMSWAGISVVGYLTDGEVLSSEETMIEQLGALADAETVISEQQVDDVLIALPAENYGKVQEMLARLVDKTCNIWLVPDYISLLIYGSKVESLGDMPMISLRAPALTGYQRLVKRAFDLLFGSIVTILTLPLFVIIAVLIRFDSPGPVLFKQPRTGENGRLFGIYKFRSMVVDADQHWKDVIRYDEQGRVIHKNPQDPRVTKVGRFLRQHSLDELPNLFNVLRGEMSMVGPRPELPILVEQYQAWQRKRFAVPPGITGWWQVNGRSERTMHLHTEDDLYYIQNYSLLLDLQILLRTAWVVLRGRGAY